MKEIVIHNWDELQKAVFDGVWEDDIMRYRSNFVYRGVDNVEHQLSPKLNRVCDFKIELEDSIIRSFKKYGYADLQGYNSFWQTLALAQHYGLPTRLLDWTYSPLVAAHFCTEDLHEYDKDAAIWCVDVGKVQQQRLPKSLSKLLNDTHTNTFTIDMLESACHNFKEFQELSKDPFFVFYEPSSLSDRITNQYALFSVVSDPNILLHDLLPDDDNSFKIIIPKEVKLEIRDKLDYINISERLIYPGLDGICKWITRRYSNLGPEYNKNHNQ